MDFAKKKKSGYHFAWQFCEFASIAEIPTDFWIQIAEIPTVWGVNLKDALTPCDFPLHVSEPVQAGHCRCPSAHLLPLCWSLAAILVAVLFLPGSFPSGFCPREEGLSGMQTVVGIACSSILERRPEWSSCTRWPWLRFTSPYPAWQSSIGKQKLPL